MLRIHFFSILRFLDFFKPLLLKRIMLTTFKVVSTVCKCHGDTIDKLSSKASATQDHISDDG